MNTCEHASLWKEGGERVVVRYMVVGVYVGVGFRVSGFGSTVVGLGFRAEGLGIRDWDGPRPADAHDARFQGPPWLWTESVRRLSESFGGPRPG